MFLFSYLTEYFTSEQTAHLVNTHLFLRPTQKLLNVGLVRGRYNPVVLCGPFKVVELGKFVENLVRTRPAEVLEQIHNKPVQVAEHIPLYMAFGSRHVNKWQH